MAQTIKTLDDYVDQVALATGDTKTATRESLIQFALAVQHDLANIRPDERIVIANVGVFSGVRRAPRPAVTAGEKEIKAIPARTAVKWKAHVQIRRAHKTP